MAGETSVLYDGERATPQFAADREGAGPGWLVAVWALAACALLAVALPSVGGARGPIGDLFAAALLVAHAWATVLGAPLFVLTWVLLAHRGAGVRHWRFGALVVAWGLPWVLADAWVGAGSSARALFVLLPAACCAALAVMVGRARLPRRPSGDARDGAT